MRDTASPKLYNLRSSRKTLRKRPNPTTKQPTHKPTKPSHPPIP